MVRRTRHELKRKPYLHESAGFRVLPERPCPARKARTLGFETHRQRRYGIPDRQSANAAESWIGYHRRRGRETCDIELYGGLDARRRSVEARRVAPSSFRGTSSSQIICGTESVGYPSISFGFFLHRFFDRS